MTKHSFLVIRPLQLALFSMQVVACAASDDQTAPSHDERGNDHAWAQVTAPGLDGGLGAPPRADETTSPARPLSTVVAPSGAYTAAARMQGRGCPQGVQPRFDETGRIELVTSDFQAAVNRQSPTASADCYVQLILQSAAGRSFSLREVQALGTAHLEEGVAGYVGLQPFFPQNLGLFPYAEQRLAGPRDERYRVTYVADDQQGKWLQCAQEHRLQIMLRARLSNDGTEAEGHLNPTGSDSSAKVIVTLNDRACAL